MRVAAGVALACVVALAGAIDVEVNADGSFRDEHAHDERPGAPPADDHPSAAAPMSAAMPMMQLSGEEDGDPVSGTCSDPAAPAAVKAAQRCKLQELQALTPEQLAEVDGMQRSALHVSAMRGHLVCLQYLLQASRLGVNAGDAMGATPLMLAAASGHAEAVQVLLDHGADVKVADVQGRGVFRSSLTRGSPAVIDLLVKAGTPLSDSGPSCLLGVAAQQNNVLALTLLEAAGHAISGACSDALQPPLSMAAQARAFDAARWLVEKGAPLDERDAVGLTPLMWAASDGNVAILQLLLDRGADWRAVNNVKYTALRIAEANERAEAIELLRRWDEQHPEAA